MLPSWLLYTPSNVSSLEAQTLHPSGFIPLLACDAMCAVSLPELGAGVCMQARG